jgi:hypothetical protein
MIGAIYLTLDFSYHEIKSKETNILTSYKIRRNRISFWNTKKVISKFK